VVTLLLPRRRGCGQRGHGRLDGWNENNGWRRGGLILVARKNLAPAPALAPLSRFAALMLGVAGLSVTGLRPRLAGPPGGWAWPA